MKCLLLLLVASLATISALPTKSTTPKRCRDFWCLKNIEDPTELDKECRRSSFFQSSYCYCCGGHEDYVEYGSVCRRYCRKITLKEGPISEPCRPIHNAPKDDLDTSFPRYPTLRPISEIMCDPRNGGAGFKPTIMEPTDEKEPVDFIDPVGVGSSPAQESQLPAYDWGALDDEVLEEEGDGDEETGKVDFVKGVEEIEEEEEEEDDPRPMRNAPIQEESNPPGTRRGQDDIFGGALPVFADMLEEELPHFLRMGPVRIPEEFLHRIRGQQQQEEEEVLMD